MLIIDDVFYLSFEDLNLGRKCIGKDLLFTQNLLLRQQGYRVIFYYLHSSDEIHIPVEYINLFLGMDRLVGGELRDRSSLHPIETFILLGCSLGRMIYGGSREKGPEVLAEMIKLGTKEIRDHLKKKFDYSLEPWTIRNIYNTIEI